MTNQLELLTTLLSQATVQDDAENFVKFPPNGVKIEATDVARAMAELVRNHKNLKSLQLSGNSYSEEACHIIALGLKYHPEFERALWSDIFTGRVRTEIPAALKHLGSAIMTSGAKLVELDLSDNALGPNGMVGLVDLLRSSSCFSLRILKLNNCGLGIGGGESLSECLMDCNKSSREVVGGEVFGLKVFIAGRNRLEDEGALKLAHVFKTMKVLEEIQMPQNGINSEGIQALADAFSHNPSLRHINLNDNTFTEIGARYMGKVLPSLKFLETVNFGDCLVRTQGALHFAEAFALGKHSHLQDVNLGFNEIGLEGAIKVVDSLVNANVKALCLNGNSLGSEGIDILKKKMENRSGVDIFGSFSDDDASCSCESSNEEDDDEIEEGSDEDVITPYPEKMIDNSILDLLKICEGDIEESVKFKKACAYADTTFQSLFSSDVVSPVIVVNALLVRMGLLKGEDRTIRGYDGDLSGFFLILNHAVKQSYFPHEGRYVLKFCLSSPPKIENKLLLNKQRNVLLKTLYTL